MTYYRQKQYMAGGGVRPAEGRRQVVHGYRTRLRMFSEDGVRIDAVLIAVLIVFLLFIPQLISDLSTLRTGSRDILKTSSRIEALQSEIRQHREEDAILLPGAAGTEQEDEALTIRMMVPEP